MNSITVHGASGGDVSGDAGNDILDAHAMWGGTGADTFCVSSTDQSIFDFSGLTLSDGSSGQGDKIRLISGRLGHLSAQTLSRAMASSKSEMSAPRS